MTPFAGRGAGRGGRAAAARLELVPGLTLSVSLYWQCRQGLPVYALLTQAVTAAARQVLMPLDEPTR